MRSRAFLKHLLKRHNQVIEVKELLNIRRFVGQVFGVILYHFTFDQVDLVVEIEAVHESVFFEGAVEGVDGLESVFLAVLEDEGEEEVDFLGVVELVQVLFEDVDYKCEELAFLLCCAFFNFLQLVTYTVGGWQFALAVMVRKIPFEQYPRLSLLKIINIADQLQDMILQISNILDKHHLFFQGP
jgi:hypothetical protein